MSRDRSSSSIPSIATQASGERRLSSTMSKSTSREDPLPPNSGASNVKAEDNSSSAPAGTSSESSVAYQYASVQQMTSHRDHIEYQLTVREQPKQSRMCGVGEKADRRPIDPAPIVQLRVITHDRPIRQSDSANTAAASPPVERKAGQGPAVPSNPEVRRGVPVSTALGDGWEDKAWYLENPYFFMYAMLCYAENDEELHLLSDGKTRYTSGSCVSCLYHLKDIDGSHQGFFVFPDLSIRIEGRYRLKLCLFETIGQQVHHCKSIYSDPFHVYTAKRFPGMEESTRLSRSFAEQGLKVRVRKQPRSRKRGSKRAKEESEASDVDQLVDEDRSSKRSRGSEGPSSEPWPPRQPSSDSKTDRMVQGSHVRPSTSPQNYRMVPPASGASSSMDGDAVRFRRVMAREREAGSTTHEHSWRDERGPPYVQSPPTPFTDSRRNEPYHAQDTMPYERSLRPRPDFAGQSGSPRMEMTGAGPSRMPLPPPYPTQSTRSGEPFASPYATSNPPYGSGMAGPSRDSGPLQLAPPSSSSRPYHRPVAAPEYMVYEERRAYEEHLMRIRREPRYTAPYDPARHDIPRRSSSPPRQPSLSRPLRSPLPQDTSWPTGFTGAYASGDSTSRPSSREYASRRSPPRQSLITPPAAHTASRYAHEASQEAYEGELYRKGRPSLPIRRSPDAQAQLGPTPSTNERYAEQMYPYQRPLPSPIPSFGTGDVRDRPMLPPLSAPSRAVTRDTSDGVFPHPPYHRDRAGPGMERLSGPPSYPPAYAREEEDRQLARPFPPRASQQEEDEYVRNRNQRAGMPRHSGPHGPPPAY